MTTLAELQKKNLAQMAAEEASVEEAEAFTQIRNASNDQIRTPLITQVRTGASKEVNASASVPAHKEVSNPLSEAEGRGADTLLEWIDAGLSSREPLEGGTKGSVEMSLELNSRVRRYLADHRGQSFRQVMVVLLDAFLRFRGY